MIAPIRRVSIEEGPKEGFTPGQVELLEISRTCVKHRCPHQQLCKLIVS